MYASRFKLSIGVFVLSTLVGAHTGFAQEPYGKYSKPPTPVTGEPLWNHVSDPKTDAAKIRAVHLYVAACDQVEIARAELAAAETAKANAGSDPKAQKKATQRLEDAKRRLATARDSFREATELDTTCADCWSMLGYTCCRTGDRDGAYGAYAKCLAINPNHFAAHEYQAESYLQDGRIHDARAELDWLKAQGNKTTLETNNLTAAIERWTKENPEKAESVPSGK